MIQKMKILYTIVPWIWDFLKSIRLPDFKNDFEVPLNQLCISYCEFIESIYELYGTDNIELSFESEINTLFDPDEIFKKYENEYHRLLSNLNMIFHIFKEYNNDLLFYTGVHDLLIFKCISLGIDGKKVDDDYIIKTWIIESHFRSKLNENKRFFKEIKKENEILKRQQNIKKLSEIYE